MNIWKELNKEVIHWSAKRTRSFRNTINSEWIVKTIWNYVESMKFLYTAKEVSWYLHKTYKVRISSWLIRKILKDFGMSYRLGKSLPVDYNEERLSLMKGLFSIKLSKVINNYDISINIDEAMFSQTTKFSHSWLLKGKEIRLKNIWFSNSTSLMAAITSYGDTFSAETQGSVTSKIFVQFLDELKWFIKDRLNTSIQKWLIILDNASILRSKAVKDYVASNCLHLAYIPAYSPELAPIEKYFSMLKRVVMKNTVGQRINWKSKKTKEILNKSMLQISYKSVRNLWKTFIYERNKCLNELNELL